MTHHSKTIFALFMLMISAYSMNAQIPDKPTEKKLLWDYANVINDAQEKALEDSLESFSHHTSNQILVMTVTSLGDYEIEEYAAELGDKWGVGHKGDDNGVVVLIKVKTSDSPGKANISPGKGMEGALPDVLCKRICEQEMKPHFMKNDYAGGIWAALAVIMPAMKGEFDKEEYLDNKGDTILGIIVFIGIMCLIFAANKNGGGSGTGTNTRTYTGGPIIFPGSFGGSSRSGGWSGGSSGGGWGGFGGGSFGGGGASCSW